MHYEMISLVIIVSGLVVLIQIWVTCAGNVIYILPDNPSNTNCSSQPCATLSQYFLDNNGTVPVVSNIEYHLLPGEHHIPPNMELNGLYNFSLIGIGDKDLSPVVMISCLYLIPRILLLEI